MADLKSILTPTFLSEIQDFWFGHLDNEDAFVLPEQKHLMRWFMGGKEFDQICVDRFAPALQAIKDSGVKIGEELLEIVQPGSPFDYLSIILLLDQMPRNCYRGDSALTAFTIFDPIALGVATRALELNIPTSPEIHYHFSRRMWFYVPLMHSESLSSHEKAAAEYERMAQDIENLITKSDVDETCDHRRYAARVVGEKVEEARGFAKVQTGYEKRHFDIIRKFGRYPHRNMALGREMTVEEREYLDNGGETFSSGS